MDHHNHKYSSININNIFSCTIATVIISCLLSNSKKMSMEHLQNATLAGGVAVGACADLMLTPGTQYSSI